MTVKVPEIRPRIFQTSRSIGAISLGLIAGLLASIAAWHSLKFPGDTPEAISKIEILLAQYSHEIQGIDPKLLSLSYTQCCLSTIVLGTVQGTNSSRYTPVEYWWEKNDRIGAYWSRKTGIHMPDEIILNFPDGMSEEDMRQAILTKFPPKIQPEQASASMDLKRSPSSNPIDFQPDTPGGASMDLKRSASSNASNEWVYIKNYRIVPYPEYKPSSIYPIAATDAPEIVYYEDGTMEIWNYAVSTVDIHNAAWELQTPNKQIALSRMATNLALPSSSSFLREHWSERFEYAAKDYKVWPDRRRAGYSTGIGLLTSISVTCLANLGLYLLALSVYGFNYVCNPVRHVKAHCLHCAGHIEYPAFGKGQIVECPHCGNATILRTRRSKLAKCALATLGIITLLIIFTVWKNAQDEKRRDAERKTQERVDQAKREAAVIRESETRLQGTLMLRQRERERAIAKLLAELVELRRQEARIREIEQIKQEMMHQNLVDELSSLRWSLERSSSSLEFELNQLNRTAQSFSWDQQRNLNDIASELTRMRQNQDLRNLRRR